MRPQDLIPALQEVVDSLKDGLPVNEVLSTLRDAKLPGCEVEYQSGIVTDRKGRQSVPYEEFIIRTKHPKFDYVHRIDFDLLRPIPAEDKKEFADHLILVLSAWIRELSKAEIDPFELMHDEMKANDSLDKEVASEFLKSRNAIVRASLIAKHGSKEEAIRYYTKECDNLRQRRKRALKTLK